MKTIRYAFVSFITFMLLFHNVTYAFEYVSGSMVEKEIGTTEVPFFEQQRGTRYNPWVVNYHIQEGCEADSNMHGGEGFQQISDIAISPVDERLMLIGTDTSGVWRTEDGGEHWFSVSNGINTWGTNDICFHPTQKNVAYMLQSGPNESIYTVHIMRRTKKDGLYKTIDGGKTWKQILHVSSRGCTTTNRLIAFDHQENIFVLTSEGLLKSQDEGNTWNFVYDFKANLEEIDGIDNAQLVNYDLCIIEDTIVFTNEEYGIFASFDAGASWQRRNVDGNMIANLTPAYGVDIDPDDKNHWLACFGGEYREIYETKDAGVNWLRLETGATDISEQNKSKKYPIKVLFGERYGDNINRTIYMAFRYTYNPFRRSVDGGKTWIEPSYRDYAGKKYDAYYGHGIQVSYSNPGTLYFCGGRVMKSTDDGQSFLVCNPGYSGAYANNMKFSSSNKLYATITDRGLYISDDAYENVELPTFTFLGGASSGDVGINPKNENHIIYANSSRELGQVYGVNSVWEKFNNIEPASEPYKLIEFHKDNENIVYTTHYTSFDRLKTWVKNSKKIHAVSSVNNDVLYSIDGKKLYKSADCGQSWELVYSAEREITDVFCDLFDVNTAWVGMLNGKIVRISENLKNSFNTRVFGEKNGLANVIPRVVVQNPLDKDHLLLGGEVGDLVSDGNIYVGYTKSNLYETRDGGETWNIVMGIPSMRVIFSMAFSPNSTEVLIGGFSGGIMIYDYEVYKKAQSSNFITISDCNFFIQENTIVASAKATNSCAKEKECNIIIAQYKGEKLVDVICEVKKIPEGVTDLVISNSVIVNKEADNAKAFIWSGISTMQPLCEAKTINKF